MAGQPPGDEPSYNEPQRGRIIWSQISMATKMAVGARNVVVDDETGYLHFRVTKKQGDFRKIIVQLTPMDTYDVKLVSINRRTYEPITEYEVEGIYAEDLSSTIYDMVHDTGTYREKEESFKNSTLREFATHKNAKEYIARTSSTDHKEILKDVHEGSINEALWAAHRQGNITIQEPRKRSRKELKERQASLESRISQHREHIKGGRTYDGRTMTEDEVRSWRTNLANMEKEFLLNDHDLKTKEGV